MKISETVFELQSGNKNLNTTANTESVVTAIHVALCVLHTGKLKRNFKVFDMNMICFNLMK